MKSFIILTLFFVLVASNTETDVVRIVDSGSTNTAGYTIELQRNGVVQWAVSPRHHGIFSTTPSTSTTQNRIQISLTRTNSIFEAVVGASPFNQYKPVFCIKSVSFGTTLHVAYGGQQSPDLNCPLQDQRLVNLQKYIKELISDLHIQTLG